MNLFSLVSPSKRETLTDMPETSPNPPASSTNVVCYFIIPNTFNFQIFN